ncbi:uncharacterized protein LOC134845176 isoform X1 [Symsagittifera roscoffensis]|uniref:uncharacterized protein LOC134845176 isoform X1 n=1 Tax=Symsagittifera roscoffensis TaxID=84072 RepID=UPI00307C1100
MAVPNITFVQTDQVDCSKIPPTDFSLLTYTEAELDSIVYLLNSTLALEKNLFDCNGCDVYAIDRYFLLFFTFVTGFIAIFFYIKANRKFRAMKSTSRNASRNSTLTKTFSLICVIWMFCYIPTFIYGVWRPHLSNYLKD